MPSIDLIFLVCKLGNEVWFIHHSYTAVTMDALGDFTFVSIRETGLIARYTVFHRIGVLTGSPGRLGFAMGEIIAWLPHNSLNTH